MKRAATVLFAGAAVTLLSSITLHRNGLNPPRLVLWAWERPEDLRFIDSDHVGIAWLAATIQFRADGAFHVRSRLQPLKLPPKAFQIAVVRFETPPRYTFPNPGPLASALRSFAERPGVQILQLDFDARTSERPFYRSLLERLSSVTSVPVTVTALASWCAGDRWLDTQAIAEAIPMYFRMGPDEPKWLPVESPVCRNAIGLSTDEIWPEHRPAGLRPNHRIYIFNPRPWTRQHLLDMEVKISQWN
jgi:hypothetical protein